LVLIVTGASRGGQVFLLQSAVFEGVEVAVDGLVDLGELGFDGGQFGALVVFSGEVPSLGADDRIGDEAVVVAVEARERIEHRGFDGVGVDAGGVALVGAGGASDIEDIGPRADRPDPAGAISEATVPDVTDVGGAREKLLP
jgi:hypothetical protein